MFELLSRLQPDDDLDLFLGQVGWAAVTPQQVCYAVLDRLPEDMVHDGLLGGAPFNPPAYCKALLLSVEFQSTIVSRLLNAYPEKPRRFFVHVPRSGGTSLGETLELHACTIPYNAMGLAWSSGRTFLDAVAQICRSVERHDAIHVTGHYTLRSLLDGRLWRFGDVIWTSLRDPRDIVVSFLNYILTTLQSDSDLVRPDSLAWSRALGLTAPIARLQPERIRQLLPRMIQDDRLLPRNLFCHFLGDGTAASTVDLLAAADVEIVASTKLDRWRERHWPEAALARANVSTPFVTWKTLGEDGQRRIEALIGQDLLLYQAVAPLFGDCVSISGLTAAGAALRRSPTPAGASGSRRVRRASRPILLDPGFVRVGHWPSGSQLGWADPPLNYHTIETTLRFPTIETRIRVRYARRRSGSATRLRYPGGSAWSGALLRRLTTRLGGWFSR